MPQVVETACMAGGVAIALAAFLLRGRWQDRASIRVGIGTVASLEIDFTASMVLSALMFAMAGLYLNSPDYHAKSLELARAQGQVSELRSDSELFKKYE